MGDVVDFEKISQEQINTDLSEVFRGAIRVTLEMLLEEEVKRMVGAKRYERDPKRKGLRNGTYLRGLITSMGHIDVTVPRTRDGSAVGVIGAYKRRSEELDEMVTEAYVSGVSHRKMADVTEALMGKAISRSASSRVAKRLEVSVEQLRTQSTRPADPVLESRPQFEDLAPSPRRSRCDVTNPKSVRRSSRRFSAAV